MKSKVKNSLRRFGAAVLAAAIALSGVQIPGVRAAAEADPIWKCQTINDTVTGTGLNQFQYFGDWGTDKNISTLYQNDGHWILVPANDDSQSRYFKMRFMGEKIELYGNKEPILGIFEVFIDGESYGMIDAYHEGTKIYQQLYFESPLLEPGVEHELKMVMTGRKNPAAGNQNGYIDFVKIYEREAEVYPAAITLDASMNMEINAEKTLNVTFAPGNTNQKKLNWKISNPDVVSIDTENKITALKEGTAAIQAEGFDADGNSILSNECIVTVEEGNLYFHGSYGSTNKTYFLTDYDALMAEDSVMSNMVTAWKKDRVYSEIVLLTKNQAFENLRVEAGDFKDKEGNTIPADQIRPSFLKYTKSSPTSGTAGENAVMTPDIIFGDVMDVAANTVQPVWVEMNIPESCEAGVYQGTIRVMDGEKELIAFEQRIEVLDLVQPSITEKGSYYLELWNYVYSSARYYGVELMSDKHIDILRPHLQQYAENGGKTVMATIVEEPWNHQTYDDSPSLVKWTRKTDGTYIFDYTLFDKYASFILGEKLAETISCYSIIPWNNQVAYFDEASNKIVKKSMPVGSADWTAAWTAFLTDFTAHLEEKGWYDHIWMAMDERGRADMTGAINLINSIKNSKGETFKISGAFNQVIPDIWVQMYHVSPGISSALNYGMDKFRQLAEERREQGLITTIYTCTGNRPNMYNMSNPSEAAWTIWMAESLNTDGFMRWAYDSWVENPLEDASHRLYETGDVQMVYPGDKEVLEKGEIPMTRSTPRTERLNEAIRDIQKLRYLKEADPESAEEMNTFVRSIRNFNGIANTPANKLLIDAEMNRMKDGLIEFSRAYIKGNKAGNIAADASIAGAEAEDARNNLIDGNLATAWDAKASEKAEICFADKKDLSKIRIYAEKDADCKNLEITVIDEKDRQISVDWFEETEGITEIEKQYKIMEAPYIGYAKAIEVRAAKGSVKLQEVMVFRTEPEEIAKSGMSVQTSSQETSAENGRAENMIDGNTGTFWHTRYSGTADRPPYTVTLDLGAVCELSEIDMLPRQSGVNGIITRYDLMLSETGEEGSYKAVITDGTWLDDNSLKQAVLHGESARYVRLIIKAAHGDFGSIAELYVYKRISAEDRNVERAEKAVAAVKESLTYTSYQKAVTFVNLLEECERKQQLLEELNALGVEKTEFDVTVNGKVVQTGAYNTKVTITAPAASEGKTFTGWKLNGILISGEETYTFYIAGDMAFEACYDAVEEFPAAMLTGTQVTKKEDGKADLKFVAQLAVPEGYTVLDAGLLWLGNDNATAWGTADGIADGVKVTAIKSMNKSNQFSVTIKGVPKEKFVRGVVYAKVTNGKETFVYSQEQKLINR